MPSGSPSFRVIRVSTFFLERQSGSKMASQGTIQCRAFAQACLKPPAWHFYFLNERGIFTRCYYLHVALRRLTQGEKHGNPR